MYHSVLPTIKELAEQFSHLPTWRFADNVRTLRCGWDRSEPDPSFMGSFLEVRAIQDVIPVLCEEISELRKGSAFGVYLSRDTVRKVLEKLGDVDAGEEVSRELRAALYAAYVRDGYGSRFSSDRETQRDPIVEKLARHVSARYQQQEAGRD